jgi:hypothetical protein
MAESSVFIAALRGLIPKVSVSSIHLQLIADEGFVSALSGAEAIKAAAPKIGSYKNVAHLDIYKNASKGSQD